MASRKQWAMADLAKWTGLIAVDWAWDQDASRHGKKTSEHSEMGTFARCLRTGHTDRSTRNKVGSGVWCCTPVILALKAEAGGSWV